MSKAILITGCSSGIGYDAAHALAARGWHVVASCRKPEDVDRLQSEGLDCVRIDYADPDTIEAGFREALGLTGGKLDALFNNGAYAIGGAIEDTDTDGFRAIFETNFFGWHTLTRLSLGVMRQAGSGRIIQCSSVLGLAGLRMRGPYVSTKFAVEGYTDVLRLELRNSGIRAILIEPGPIRTLIRENARPHYERWVDRTKGHWAEFYKSTLEPRLYAENPPPDQFELGPEAVTKKLIHALESPRPRDRYYVTTPTYIVGYLRRLLPTRWLDRILIKG